MARRKKGFMAGLNRITSSPGFSPMMMQIGAGLMAGGQRGVDPYQRGQFMTQGFDRGIQSGLQAGQEARTQQGFEAQMGAERQQQQAQENLYSSGMVSPEQEMFMRAGQEMPSPPDPFTLSPGQERFGGGGESIAQVAPNQQEPPNKWQLAMLTANGNVQEAQELIKKWETTPLVSLGQDKPLSVTEATKAGDEQNIR